MTAPAAAVSRRALSRPDVLDRLDERERHDARQDASIATVAADVEAVKKVLGRLPDPLKDGDEGEGVAGVLGRMYREQSIDRAIRERRAKLWKTVGGVIGGVAGAGSIVALVLKALGKM